MKNSRKRIILSQLFLAWILVFANACSTASRNPASTCDNGDAYNQPNTGTHYPCNTAADLRDDLGSDKNAGR